MSSWGNNDNAANAPYWAVSTVSTGVNKAAAAPTAANVALLYGNTTPSVYVTNETVGLFLVDAKEEHAGGDRVTFISVSNPGSGYVESPGIDIQGGGGSDAAASSVIAGGKVTEIDVTNVGSSYETVPTVTVQIPLMTVTTSHVITANDTIMYTGHSQANAAPITYQNGGGTTLNGLVQGNTYYVIPVTADKFQVANTAADAANNISVNLIGGGNNGQYFSIDTGVRATALASKGSGGDGVANSGYTHATHVGWNLMKVGTGNRAGRVQYETLVALANPIGDGSDDTVLPE